MMFLTNKRSLSGSRTRQFYCNTEFPQFSQKFEDKDLLQKALTSSQPLSHLAYKYKS